MNCIQQLNIKLIIYEDDDFQGVNQSLTKDTPFINVITRSLKVINTNKVLKYTDILIQLDLTKRVYQFFTLFHFDTHSLINH